MEDYIREISSVLEQNIQNRKELTKPMTDWLRDEGIQKGKTLVIVASGSSYHAVFSALPFMERYMKNRIKLITPFTFSYYEEPGDDRIYVFVSQSGSSTNVVEAIKKYQKTGRQAMAVLGKVDSAIGEMSDFHVTYGVGEERVGYVTKGMTTLCCYFMLISLELAEAVDKTEYDQTIEQLRIAAGNHHCVYKQAKEFCSSHRKELLAMKSAFVIGCGANLGTAMEGALKISEMVHIQSSYYETEEFIHGPDLQLAPDDTLFFIDGGDQAGKRTREIWQAAKEITKTSYLVRLEQNEEHKTKEYVSSLYLAAFFQYLACWTARERNITTEHPLYAKFEEKIHCKTGDYEEDAPF